MTPLLPEPDPALYLNPWVASPYTMQALARGVRWCLAPLRRRAEIRRLNRIPVLPVGWDVAGRRTSR